MYNIYVASDVHYVALDVHYVASDVHYVASDVHYVASDVHHVASDVHYVACWSIAHVVAWTVQMVTFLTIARNNQIDVPKKIGMRILFGQQILLFSNMLL